MEKCTKPSSSNKNDDSKKYKFYRKPSIKKKGPEVKHTKTSLARLLKANPLLKLESNTKQGPSSSNTEIKLGPEAPKISIRNISRNGPYLKPRIINFDRHRISSSDFVNPILSSTLIESDDVFNGQATQAQRNSLSSQYRKKQGFQEITKKKTVTSSVSRNRVISLRRSKSVDNVKVCYRIEEEGHLSESKSTQSLNQKKEADEIATSTVLTEIAWEDLKTRPDKYSVKQITIPTNGELYDDENKENIEVSILESDSYEDLKICNGDDLK